MIVTVPLERHVTVYDASHVQSDDTGTRMDVTFAYPSEPVRSADHAAHGRPLMAVIGSDGAVLRTMACLVPVDRR